jgi:hypothetical protein
VTTPEDAAFESAEFHRTLLAAEYASLRDESAQARQAQQSVLQWSLGAASVLLAGAVAFTSKESPASSATAVFLLIYGFGMPAFAAAAFMAWFGELIRMERAGMFLRARERQLWPVRAPADPGSYVTEGDAWQHPIMMWENWISFSKGGFGARKQIIGYLGGLIIYVGAFATSEFAFAIVASGHEFQAHSHGWHVACVAWAVVATVAFAGFAGAIILHFKALGKRVAGPNG